jgi:uncharacterized protein (TIGR03067 family)
MARCLATLAVMTFGVFFAAEQARATDAEQLTGSWELTIVNLSGQEISIEALRMTGIRDAQIQIENGNLKFELLDSSQAMELPFTLDGMSEPKQIDLRSADNKVRKGIYKLNGDELELCVGPDDGSKRPKDFVDIAGEPYVYAKLQRIK